MNNEKNVETLRSQHFEEYEPEVIGEDWKGEDLFKGDVVFMIDGDIVLADTDSVYEYVEDRFQKEELTH